jgi:PqqD family protein of HPr-rel-A system
VIWCLAPGQRLLHRCWEDECVIYNDLSGDTHLLDEFTWELLRLLQAAPQTTPTLAEALGLDIADGVLPDGFLGHAFADGPNGPDPDGGRSLLGTVLAELMALHLVDHLAC